MTVLVLGATGFIGSWAVRALLRRGEVVVMVRPASDTWRIDGLQGLVVRRIDKEAWGEELVRIRPEVVVSLDWSGVAGAHRDDDAQWANLERQRLILDASAAAGVRRFVGVGSQAEYGPYDGMISETLEPHPVTEYGRAKLAAFEALRSFCERSGIEWIWARVFSTYGPLDHGHWLLPQVAAAMLEGRDVGLSAGTQTWSYLYGQDAGEAMAVLATAISSSAVVNVGHPEAPTLRSIIEEFAAHLPAGGRLLFGAMPLGAAAVRQLEPDTSRLSAMGWAPGTPLDLGLELTARWLSGDEVADPGRPGRSLPAPR